MARKRRSSIVHQVVQAINEIYCIGQSKREARKNDSVGIHSIKQIKETLSACQNFVRFVRNEFGILSIYQLNETHYRDYLKHLTDKSRTAGHRQNVETALRHLQKGMRIRSERLSYPVVIFVPEKRITDWRELKKAEDRSYSQNEYEILLPFLSKNVRGAVQLQRNIGLRVKEACNVQVHHFHNGYDGSYKLIIPEEESGGITKGGRYRITPVPDHFITVLHLLLKGKAAEECLIPIKPDTVRKCVNEACKKAGILQNGRGTHGFRHLYCRDRLRQLLAAESIEMEGIMLLQRIMANRDQGRKADYSILTEQDKELYQKLKKIIDQIHEEIGHGEDRWDLAERYLR